MSKMRMLGLIGLAIGCFGGCTQLDFERKMAMAREVRAFAEESGASYSLEFQFGGQYAVGHTQEYYLNTGVGLIVRVAGQSEFVVDSGLESMWDDILTEVFTAHGKGDCELVSTKTEAGE